MTKKTQKSNKFKWILKLILGGIFIKFFVYFFKERKNITGNFKDFLREEKREICELKNKKESFSKYCCDSSSLFFDYFIPSYNNDHKPKILRPRSLATIAIATVALKVFVVGYLFFIYPNQAIMTELVIKKVFELTNQDRVANGLNSLKMNSVLTASATAKANDMITNNYFAHHSPSGKKPWDWINRADYPYIFVGENLAMNFTSGDAVHAALMKSPTHKKNILNERYNEIGLAMLSGQIDGKNTNILVELFGTTGNTVTTASAPALEEKNINVETSNIESGATSVLGTTEKVAETITAITKVEEIKTPVAPVVKEEVKPIPVPEIKVEKVTAPVVATSMREENKTTQETAPIAKVIEVEQISPNPELEYNPEAKVVYITPEENRRFGFATSIVRGSNYFYMGLLSLLIIIFLINIFVRITVQHKPVIFQTLFVILFIFSIASVKVHVLENVLSGIAIL